MLKRIMPNSYPLNQITMIGPYVTLYLPLSEYNFNNHKLCVFSDIDPDHDDAHGNNILAMLRDKAFAHFHVILPGKQPLDVELKNLLMSDQSKYGISESQIDQCVQQYRCHVENYSPSEHKLAVRNLIRSVIKYHFNVNDTEALNVSEIEGSIMPVKRALAISMIERNYASLENFRNVLHETLNSLRSEDKNTFIKSLCEVSPDSPFYDFNRLMSSNSIFGKEPSLLGMILMLAPVISYLPMRIFLNRITADNSSEKIEMSPIEIPLMGWMFYKSPEIAEIIYNQGRQLLYGKQPYVVNKKLKLLVDDYQESLSLPDDDIKANIQKHQGLLAKTQ